MIEVRRARIDLEAVVDSVRRDDAGAIVLFVGTVRSDERVRALDYEVYRPMAIKSLTALAERAKDKFGLTDLSIVHRLGRVPVGGAHGPVHRPPARPRPGRRGFRRDRMRRGPSRGSLRGLCVGHGRGEARRADLENRDRRSARPDPSPSLTRVGPVEQGGP